MAERFELVEKAILKMMEDKKYSTLRDILITMNPADVPSAAQGTGGGDLRGDGAGGSGTADPGILR